MLQQFVSETVELVVSAFAFNIHAIFVIPCMVRVVQQSHTWHCNEYKSTTKIKSSEKEHMGGGREGV